MKRVVCTVIGLALCTGAVLGFCYALYTLGRIGTCASGGPYVSARPCPAGTAETALLIPASIIGGLAGIGVYMAGGRFARPSPISLGILMWSFTFLGAAGSLAYAAWGPAASADGGGGVEGAAVILLVVFIPMGLAPLIMGLVGRKRRGTAFTMPGRTVGAMGGTARAAPTTTFVVGSSVGSGSGTAVDPTATDVVSRLERLSALRQAGAITEAEFARLKAEVLRES